jgi:hypothetical protein
MDDSLTIRFLLPEGQTAQGKRSEWTIVTFVTQETVEARIDPSRQDLGIGTLLDDPDVIAVNATWLDDYDDNQQPILAVTALYRPCRIGHPNACPAIEVTPSAIRVPYHPTGAQLMEWIATYMRDNVYHDGIDPNA